jgi:hypothetical protein
VEEVVVQALVVEVLEVDTSALEVAVPVQVSEVSD